ncbi:Chromatin remodeling complex subunit [Heracleum sosnowskyi]|uniref:Chromatin remodeling complex subunit n=1 Tax=Heracleum sosnowskyi TaxID=360622 RepID=A0AAD8HUQ0_9APIA|nr:Chromatin remodeling complex subunit [Heracleum sosnowskyi]
MAFYRNYSSEPVSDGVLDEKGRGPDMEKVESIVGNEDVNLSDRDFDINLNAEYRSDGEADDGGKFQQDVGDGGAFLDAQPSTRKMTSSGRWGSTFWKDCQPMRPGSDSGHESKSSSEFKNGEGSEDESLGVREDRSESDDPDTVRRRQADVPVDEMLSDDYYEQDGDERPNDLMHHKLGNNSVGLNSNSKPRPIVADMYQSGRSKALNDDEYGDDDADYEDDGDGDDPNDADFDPDITSERPNQNDDWEGENIDEDFNDDDLDILDEDDDLPRKSKGRQRGKGGLVLKHSRVHKSITSSSQRKRGGLLFEDDESSAKDSDNDSDEGFSGRARRGTSLRKKNIARATSYISSQDRETRTSRRSVQKVSYAESEDSEENDESKKRKSQKEEIEEEDGDSIERVLWHQPKGMAEEAFANNKLTEPVLLSHLYDYEPDWNEMEFYIKWKGQSHLHCQWKSIYELQNLSGFKKVINYTKKVMEDVKYRKAVSREEIEVHDVSKEMDLDLIKQNSQVERVIAERVSKDSLDNVEYLVKWQGLSYAEATWEKYLDISFAQESIDEFKAREAAVAIQGKMVDVQRRKSKASLRKLDEQPEWLKGGKLRDYQLEGLNFLVNSWRNDTNVILADEMGLGKTVQSVSMLGFLQNAQQIHGPFLVVVPLSTLSNWAKEFKKWLPKMNVIIYVGARASREVCQQYEFYSDKKNGRGIKFDALLTTYEVLLKDKGVLSRLKWNYLMVDEAHRLKNSEAALYISLAEFSTKNKLLITGTPLQNSVEELWALLHFLDPDKFKSKDEFVQNYKNLSSFNENELANLHMELRPHILRRVIKDVEKSLPPKIERVLRVEMSPLQKQYYKWILERNFQDLNKGVRGNQVSLLNIVVELKKCCNHPFLFESADHGYGGETNITGSSKLERIILSSGKLVILDKLLDRLNETNHRVLIFSQMVRMLDILAEYLSIKGFKFQRLDGSTKAEVRHQAMEHFNAPGSDDFCFLLSTRAGGLGINLATADTVIIFDSDWNPQNDLQAMSRAHRIGQQDVVNIYRFVTSKSVEEDILERAKKKMVLDHLVIQKLNAEGKLEKKETKKGSSFDKNELSAILRFGAEELFKEDKNDEESKKRLLSMDIDEILERAEKVEEKSPDEEEGNELLSAFKVANFCTAEDDGSFWSRWIKPDAVNQAEEALAPRAARNSKSYAETNLPDKLDKRRRKGVETQERFTKRRKSDTSFFVPAIDGATAQVRGWSYGNLPKRDATRFFRAVKKFGNDSQIGLIAAEVGGSVEAAPTDAQIELFDALIDGCREAVDGMNPEPKGPTLDFFGVPVKADDLLTRVEELQLLAKRISRYEKPISQFQALMYLKPATWSKGCGWNQKDDARLLLGIHYHGFGNWEKIRLDETLGLTKKIAPVELQHHETFLPRAPQLKERASQLLEMEFIAVSGSNSNAKASRKASKKQKENSSGISLSRSKGKQGKPGSPKYNAQIIKVKAARTQKVEPLVKEEGEMSDTEEVYEQFKEVKWMEWCEDVMADEKKTLTRLQRLQTTSSELPKEKVLSRIRNYLQILGRRVDQILFEHKELPKQDRMKIRLWKYISTFSNLSGEGLYQIYSKLKQEQDAVGLAPNHVIGSSRGYRYETSNQISGVVQRGIDTGKFEAWKRMKRGEAADTNSLVQPLHERSLSNATRISEPKSSGILGSGPSDSRYSGNEKSYKMRQAGQPSRQGFPSGVK